MAKLKEAASHPWAEFGIGDQVKHPQWGDGTIMFLSGSGDDTKAVVVFPEESQKKLMLRYANLKKVRSTSGKGESKSKAKRVAVVPEPEPEKAAGETEAEAEMNEPEAFAEDEEGKILSRGGDGKGAGNE